ncbi:dTDP-4-dehydrorhamnose reductase [uncultured Pelagimonas sp.]|uniref:dTDP-4-dehydrorhamnose reductase n=1 Tax=uncultured Pelagimonas sp. TaxID=1618102 RepID=UPI00262AB4C4|nr:dTDP-4-dehydrorhamnose reductase [uncultured Pelagimonas sp.]
MILVFGKSGQVAQELQHQGDVMAFGRDDVDLMLPGAAKAAIDRHKPRLVINAAAYTAVDKAEDDEAAAHQLNAVAPGEMALACADLGCPFLHISTDYVFDGSGQSPWRENDPVAPLGAYGRTKLAGEEAVRAANGHHAILRTSWVFSAHGGNFVKTMLRLSETRDALNVVGDQIGGPTPAGDIAATLLEMGHQMQAGHAGGTYHYGGQPSVSWADFARAIFDQAGRDMRVTDIPSSDYPTPACRPFNSRLDCSKLKTDFNIAAPDWTVGLTAVLKNLETNS